MCFCTYYKEFDPCYYKRCYLYKLKGNAANSDLESFIVALKKSTQKFLKYIDAFFTLPKIIYNSIRSSFLHKVCILGLLKILDDFFDSLVFSTRFLTFCQAIFNILTNFNIQPIWIHLVKFGE